ncbi:MAG: adenylate cyclase [Solirubrobacteraceae bacterium]|nr:adenylate cyclase [Solirubrobacteraceae bacterium]
MLFLGAGALVVALALTLYLSNALLGPELGSVDRRFAVRPQPAQPKDIAVVAIDDKTFDVLKLRWPFDRRIHAQVIDRLRRDGAKVIVVDIQFTERTGNSPEDIDNDNALFSAVQRTPRIALATTEVSTSPETRGQTRVLGGGAALKASGAKVGNAVFPNDRGGTIRRLRYSHQGLVTLPIATAQLATGRRIRPGDLGGGDAWIDFRGPPRSILTRSYSDVLRGRFAAGTFRDRIVVVGPDAGSLQDVHPTSTTGQGLMSGAEIQANAIWTALHGFDLQPASRRLGALIVLLMALAAPLAFFVLGARIAGVLLVALGAAYLVAAQLLFDAGTIMPLVAPLAALLLGLIVALGVLIATGAFERERVRDLFSRFVPESVVREVLAKIDDDLRLGGERREATVLFSDLRGFTSFADARAPDEVIETLNRYLTLMSDAILDHGGTLVSYMGDGIMAVFGAPNEQEDHAERALAAARHMAGPALDEFNAWMHDSDVGPNFRMGVGLNSGVVMSGNVGSRRRLEYTAIGDTTNTAARLEAMTKATPYSIFVGESTRALLREPPEDLVHVDRMEIRGKQERLGVWGILDSVEVAPAPPPSTTAAAEPEPPVPAEGGAGAPADQPGAR